jgi:hypothetical protein
MKHFTIIYVLLLTSLNLVAQRSGKPTPFDVKKAESPSTFNDKQAERVSKARALVSADEVNLCLFNHLEIRAAYSELLALRDFYQAHNAVELWKTAQKEIFADRKNNQGRQNCVSILKLYPDYVEPTAPPKFSHARALRETMSEELLAEFSFCLSYIGLEYLDKEIWDTYVSREVSLIKEIKDLQGASLRLKGLMLALDFKAKVCFIENGFSQQVK